MKLLKKPAHHQSYLGFTYTSLVTTVFGRGWCYPQFSDVEGEFPVTSVIGSKLILLSCAVVGLAFEPQICLVPKFWSFAISRVFHLYFVRENFTIDNLVYSLLSHYLFQN